MHLLLRKSQRDDGWVLSSVTFIIEAQLELTLDEAELFDKYNLADVVIYDSENRVYYGAASAESYHESSQSFGSVPVFIRSADDVANIIGGIAAGFWHLGSGVVYHTASALSLQITLGSLIDGQYVESESLEETLALYNTIKGAVQYIADYLDVALTFDGREDLSEF